MGYRSIMIGLEIFLRVDPAGYLQAEHDIIYGPYAEDLDLSEYELNILENHGWRIDSDSGCWSHNC